MPNLTIPMAADGPLIEVAVMASQPRQEALRAAQLRPPEPAILHGLIDTGASCTCIDPDVIARLGLKATGIAQITTPSTGNVPFACSQFDISLAIVLGEGRFHVVDTLPVIATNLLHHGYGALIGRDVLACGLVVYNGEAQQFTVCF